MVGSSSGSRMLPGESIMMMMAWRLFGPYLLSLYLDASDDDECMNE